MLNILGKRYIFFAISLLLILPGLTIIALRGMPMSIDFQGGSLLEVSFSRVRSLRQTKSLHCTTGWASPKRK